MLERIQLVARPEGVGGGQGVAYKKTKQNTKNQAHVLVFNGLGYP